MPMLKTLFFILLVFLTAMPVAAREAFNLPDFTQLVDANHLAVVNISTLTHNTAPTHPGFPELDDPELQNSPLGEFLRRFLEQQPNQGGNGGPEGFDSEASGSGFIISEDGYVLTNNHVVADADEVTVRLTDRRQFVAKVIGTDVRSDIALLKVDANDLPFVTTGSSESLKVGEWVLAIGSPFGFDFSVTAGIVSAKQRALPNESYVPFIQTDVAINPGNSGGPLFNLAGEVVGINSQIYSRSGGFMGLSFAIPIDIAMEVVAQLKSGGAVSRGWLGVVIQEVTRDLAKSFGMKKAYGALVARILPDSPASRSDIQVGDVIVSFNGHMIERSSSLPPVVGRSSLTTPADVVVMRDGRKQKLKVTLGELPTEKDLARAVNPNPANPVATVNTFAVEVTELTEQHLQELGRETQGLLVERVLEGPAQQAGMLDGDLIVSINNRLVNSVDQFAKLLQNLKSGSTVPVLVERLQGPVFLAIRVP